MPSNSYNIFDQILRGISGAFCCLAYVVYLFFCGFAIIPAILILNIIATIFDVSWFFQGIEEFKLIAYRNFVIIL